MKTPEEEQVQQTARLQQQLEQLDFIFEPDPTHSKWHRWRYYGASATFQSIRSAIINAALFALLNGIRAK